MGFHWGSRLCQLQARLNLPRRAGPRVVRAVDQPVEFGSPPHPGTDRRPRPTAAGIRRVSARVRVTAIRHSTPASRRARFPGLPIRTRVNPDLPGPPPGPSPGSEPYSGLGLPGPRPSPDLGCDRHPQPRTILSTVHPRDWAAVTARQRFPRGTGLPRSARAGHRLPQAPPVRESAPLPDPAAAGRGLGGRPSLWAPSAPCSRCSTRLFYVTFRFKRDDCHAKPRDPVRPPGSCSLPRLDSRGRAAAGFRHGGGARRRAAGSGRY